jgi:hypothetical protein
MQLELSAEQADVLHDYLDKAVGDLGMEIAATDSPHFREQLREQRDALRRVRDAIDTARPVR